MGIWNSIKACFGFSKNNLEIYSPSQNPPDQDREEKKDIDFNVRRRRSIANESNDLEVAAKIAAEDRDNKQNRYNDTKDVEIIAPPTTPLTRPQAEDRNQDLPNMVATNAQQSARGSNPLSVVRKYSESGKESIPNEGSINESDLRDAENELKTDLSERKETPNPYASRTQRTPTKLKQLHPDLYDSKGNER